MPVEGVLDYLPKAVENIIQEYCNYSQENSLSPLYASYNYVGDNVEEGSILVTDSYRSYSGLDARFTHVAVKHENGGGYVVKIGNEKFHTNNIENFWSIFKRGIIGIYHFVSVKHLERYCQEFRYRYNMRDLSGVEKFENALLKVASARITYNSLIGK